MSPYVVDSVTEYVWTGDQLEQGAPREGCTAFALRALDYWQLQECLAEPDAVGQIRRTLELGIVSVEAAIEPKEDLLGHVTGIVRAVKHPVRQPEDGLLEEVHERREGRVISFPGRPEDLCIRFRKSHESVVVYSREGTWVSAPFHCIASGFHRPNPVPPNP